MTAPFGYGAVVFVVANVTWPRACARVFSTPFDPEAVGDIIQGFAASVQKNVVDILNAPNGKSRRQAIDASVRRLKLYGIATDRILGRPEGSTVVLNRKQVEAMVALL